ncbi:MAG: GNAT family N-acetyltransferase [Leptospiraceae bacterium]|nr:GNAT family N-acetyltransferase [Leptospiraceae bacterium]MCP5513817.1 GNAT family N-acetyltransferase [Leptospiraceae bacterium]
MKVYTSNSSDLPFLRDMLCIAAYWDHSEVMNTDVYLEREDLRFLLDEWGKRKGDLGLILQDDSGQNLGAVWYRFWWESFHSYGFISEKIPELVIGLKPGSRGKGYGEILIRKLIEKSSSQGIHSISLSVARGNYAIRLYQKLGFRVYRENELDYIMIY